MRESDSDSFIAAKNKNMQYQGVKKMSNEVVGANLESVQVLEWQGDSELSLAGLGEGQAENFQNFPIMLFESPADVTVGPATRNPDRLI